MIISTAAILLALSILQHISSSYGFIVKPRKVHGAMVDCGSSGTRVFIFEQDEDLRFPELLNRIEPMRDEKGQLLSMKIKPGLSSLKDRPDKADIYMRPIVDFILQKLPRGSEKTTSVYVMATAGMRLLDEDKQSSIMDDIAKWLKKEHNFAKVVTKVISGAAEGVYQWIKANTEKNRFSKNLNSITRRTYGILEMGGASVQVTYQLDRSTRQQIIRKLSRDPAALKAFRKSIVKPEISREAEDYDYTLVSTTFLGFGGNSAREAFVDLLIHEDALRKNLILDKVEIGETLDLKDPCLPPGASQTFDKPLNMFRARNQTIGFMVKDASEGTFKVKVYGTGNFSECRAKLDLMLKIAKNERMNCNAEEVCATPLLGTLYVPFNSFESLGLSDFYYTTKEILHLDGTYNRNRIAQKTKTICETPYKKLLELYPEANRNDSTRVLTECFKSVWIDTFLFKGLKMHPKAHSLTTVELPEAELGWTLGAVIDKALAIDAAANKSLLRNVIEKMDQE